MTRSGDMRRDCRFYDNIAPGGGGLVVAWGSLQIVKDAIFDDNHATGRDTIFGGGGIWHTADSRSYLYNVVLRRNSAFSGGGFFNSETTAGGVIVMENVSISDNIARVHGGGGFFSLVSVRLYLVRFTNNTAKNGAGVVFDSGSSATMHSCFFIHNKARLNGGAVLGNGQDTVIRASLTKVELSSALNEGAGIYLSGAATMGLNDSFITACIAGKHGGGAYVPVTDCVCVCVCASVLLCRCVYIHPIIYAYTHNICHYHPLMR